MKKVLNTSGIISRKLSEFYELGYSSAGIVEKVGGVKNFSKGDLVACTGGGFASHAEKILVPENLVVRVKKTYLFTQLLPWVQLQCML